jgi:hypothetical protein
MMRNFLFVILLSAAASLAAAPPREVEIGYELTRNGMAIAEVTDRLQHDGKSYQLSETWKGKGVFGLKGNATRSSQGSIAAGGLQPRQFEDKRSGRDPVKVDLDPAKKQQDRLSFIWTFAFAPPGGPVALSVVDGRGTSAQTWQPAGREKVKTPAGEFDALKLVRAKGTGDERGAEIWLATDRNYLPVRVLVTEKDGTRLDTVAVRISAK